MATQKRPLRLRPPGLGPPGPNPLFFGVVVALAIGVVAGVTSSGTKTLLGSDLVFRLAVGGIAFVLTYVVVAAVWFAWHRRTFKAIHLAGAGADAPEQIESETNARDDDIAEFMETTTAAIEELNARLDALE
jgi:hypothetical protein